MAPETILRTNLFSSPTHCNLLAHLRLIYTRAGFGKTTLVVDWIKQIDLLAAWLSLDETGAG
jgi:ATP/maltotriose-dependent transcriptional regulator MalT